MSEGEEDDTAIPSSVTTPIDSARTALTAVETSLHGRQYAEALASLTTLRRDLAEAHRAGMALVGAPPSDPEEDEPPGPGAVIAVLDLDHQVAMRLLPYFDAMTRNDVVSGLQTTLSTTFANRTSMLDAIVRIPEDEEGPDYSDGMSDTLGLYGREVRAYTSALEEFRLTPLERSALSDDLTRVRATRTTVTHAFGGGE
jgi:hypothetical protein